VSGANFLGLDFTRETIQRAKIRTCAKSDRLTYQVQDLNALSLQHKTLDCMISIDTLYFVKDLKKTLQQIKEALKSDGKLLIFYSSRRKEVQQTDLAVALTHLGFDFEVWDFTAAEKAIWEKSLLYAEELKDAFVAEGAQSLYRGRVAEATRNIKWQNEGRMSRYLYFARLT
jgi:SAM-dependent methyltransferase